MKRRITYYEFQFGDKQAYLGGSGIELVSLANYLKAQADQVTVNHVSPAISCRQTRWPRLNRYLSWQRQEAWQLLTSNEEILLFFYPKIPFIGYSGAIKVIVTALLVYSLLAIKKRLTNQQIVVLILDLPLEQHLMTEIVCSPKQLPDHLTRFYNWQHLSWTDFLLSWLEWVLFKQADTLVSLSPVMTQHLIKKHNLSPNKIVARGRNFHLPTYSHPLPAVKLAGENGLRVFYSGDLVRTTTVKNLKRIMKLFQLFPQAHLYLCGRQGEWINQEAQSLKAANIHYLGSLDYGTHDAVARQCDVGLLLYTFAYAHLVPTSKYSAYVSNGLVVLSTDMITLATNIQNDGVGMALPLDELLAQLEHWLRYPEQIEPYRQQAQRLSKQFTQSSFMQEWFEATIC